MKSLELNGKEYKIEFDINSGCDLEDKSGKPIGTLVNEAFNNFSLTNNRLILWGALRKHYPDLTLTDVGELLRGTNPVEILNACVEEMNHEGFFGKAVAKTPPKKEASGKSIPKS